MSEHNLTESVLSTIKDKHIIPKPRWEFLLQDSAVWIAGIISFLVGGIAISVMIHLLTSDDFAIAVASGIQPSAIFLASIPYFWILFFIAFIAIAHYNLKHTKRGYRYTLPVFAIASVLISGVFGVIFYAMGIGPDIESELSEHLPAYTSYGHPRALLWSHPEQGMIAGTVTAIDDDTSFELRDFRSIVWKIEPASSTSDWPQMAPGMRVRIVGQEHPHQDFRAEKILPWRPDSPTFFNSIPPRPMPRNFPRQVPEQIDQRDGLRKDSPSRDDSTSTKY